MQKLFKFGEDVDGYTIPVLNEREIRAAAGLLFLMMMITIMVSGATQNYASLKFAVIIFMSDLLIRVLVNPRFSPFLIVGRWLVRKQTPEYVGAPQKRFAWSIGIGLTISMVILMTVLNAFGAATSIICMICLAFLFFETSFGICMGCWVYGLIFRKKAQYCPGDVCEIKDRHDIQKTGVVQWITVFTFAFAMTGLGIVLAEQISIQPEFIKQAQAERCATECE